MIKKTLLKNKRIKFLYDEGFHTPNHYKIRLIMFLFQRFFRINSHCKFQVHFTSQVLHPERIRLGRRVRRSFLLSGNCYIQANNGIQIGDNTIFAPGTKIISANHDFSDINNHLITDPIVIGNNCWIGTGSVILPSVKLGNNVIVGANSVVTKSFVEDNIIIAGVPAKVIKRLESKS